MSADQMEVCASPQSELEGGRTDPAEELMNLREVYNDCGESFYQTAGELSDLKSNFDIVRMENVRVKSEFDSLKREHEAAKEELESAKNSLQSLKKSNGEYKDKYRKWKIDCQKQQRANEMLAKDVQNSKASAESYSNLEKQLIEERKLKEGLEQQISDLTDKFHNLKKEWQQQMKVEDVDKPLNNDESVQVQMVQNKLLSDNAELRLNVNQLTQEIAERKSDLCIWSERSDRLKEQLSKGVEVQLKLEKENTELKLRYDNEKLRVQELESRNAELKVQYEETNRQKQEVENKNAAFHDQLKQLADDGESKLAEKNQTIAQLKKENESLKNDFKRLEVEHQQTSHLKTKEFESKRAEDSKTFRETLSKIKCLCVDEIRNLRADVQGIQRMAVENRKNSISFVGSYKRESLRIIGELIRKRDVLQRDFTELNKGNGELLEQFGELNRLCSEMGEKAGKEYEKLSAEIETLKIENDILRKSNEVTVRTVEVIESTEDKPTFNLFNKQLIDKKNTEIEFYTSQLVAKQIENDELSVRLNEADQQRAFATNELDVLRAEKAALNAQMKQIKDFMKSMETTSSSSSSL